ncbi:MAG TPA: universal stress protein [Solirubrobacteraceae bacterium]
MFKNVLVGVDAHEGGRDAVALGRRLLADGGELTLAYVYAGDARTWRGSNATYDAVEAERARELLEQASREAGVQGTPRWIGAPSVGHGLHVLAEDVGADLLVVGSTRRGLLGRVHLADDTRAALNGAPCPVAVAPAGYKDHPVAMREIGVGYDGSPESEHALSVARALAAELHCEISALEAVSVPTYLAHGRSAPDGTPITELVSESRDRIAALGGVTPHAVYGDPAEELALYSASLDVLVIGSRSYGPIGRLLHGSTAHRLARSARCPLLILTKAAGRAEAGLSTEPGSEQPTAPALS